MTFKLPELPFETEAFGNRLSKETFEYHYGKHHAAYVNNLNKLIVGTPFENASLEEIIKKAQGPVFNNAAQVWNHTFYWDCLSPKQTSPSGALMTAINKQFNSYNEFREKFTQAAIGQFGSGWGWLVKNPDGSLAIETTGNAANPMTGGKKPLLTCDVWEHAYYIDYRNNRAKYIETFLDMINWKFVGNNHA